MHLTEDMYILLLRGVLEPSQLVEAAHAHSVDACDLCGEEWRSFLAGRDGEGLDVVATPDEGPALPPRCAEAVPALPEDDDALSVADCDRWKELVSRMRHETRKAREDVGQLLELPVGEWEGRVERATTRFRSRAFAQHLLTRCREEVRDAPRVAERLAALVPLVLRRLPGARDEAWGAALQLRAEAYRANAERVCGDLPAAGRRFAALRARLRPPVEEAVLAEVDSLEASLRYDQRLLEEAERLLTGAVAMARRSGHRRVVCRALIQSGVLQWRQGHPERALALLESASQELDPDDRSYDRACLIGNQVMALCELQRYAEAYQLLNQAEPLLHTHLHSAAYVSGIRGRVALGLERWEEAADQFRAARETLLELGRDYDAALTCLDLAHAHLAAGDTAALRKLARGLVPMFSSRDVERETLAVLRLLAEAVHHDRATVALLADLRRRLQTMPG